MFRKASTSMLLKLFCERGILHITIPEMRHNNVSE